MPHLVSFINSNSTKKKQVAYIGYTICLKNEIKIIPDSKSFTFRRYYLKSSGSTKNDPAKIQMLNFFNKTVLQFATVGNYDHHLLLLSIFSFSVYSPLRNFFLPPASFIITFPSYFFSSLVYLLILPRFQLSLSRLRIPFLEVNYLSIPRVSLSEYILMLLNIPCLKVSFVRATNSSSLNIIPTFERLQSC